MKLETPSTITSVPNSLSWTTIDSLQVPCFTRKERNYIPARLVEERLLSQYPSNIDNVNPLIGYHATQHEVQTLNDILAKTDDINGKTVDEEAMMFTTEDVLVSLEDFRSFYADLKRRFDNGISTSGGWLQVNNVVVPYVYRNGAKLVPIEIVRYGGHLLTNVDTTELEVEALTAEVDYLNGRFETGGFSFALRPSESKLISLTVVWSLCGDKKPRIHELPAGAADDPMVHASFDDTAIIEVQSSVSSADSDLEIICREDEVTPAVTPILIAPTGEGDVETCETQENVTIENPEWGAAEHTVVLQTPIPVPTSIPCSQISEAILNNLGVDFVANSSAETTVFLNPEVSNDAVRSPLRNAGNELRDLPSSIPVATSRTRGKAGKRGKRRNVETVDVRNPLGSADNGLGNPVGPLENGDSGLRYATISTRGATRGGTRGRITKRGNPRDVEKQWAMRANASMAPGDEKEKRRQAKNAELIRMNSSSVPFLLNANTASTISPATTQFSDATMRQFNLRPQMMNQLMGNATHASNGSFYDSSVDRNAQPYNGFPAVDGSPHLQGGNSMYFQHNNRFPATGFTPAYPSLPQPYTTRHYLQNTQVSAPPNVATSLSNNAASEQRSALSSTASSVCYGDTASSGRNGLASVLPSGAVAASEMSPSQYNTSPNGNARSSCHGNMVSSHGNNMNPDGCNGPAPAYPGNTILSNMSSMSYETFYSNRNDGAPALSQQILSPQQRRGLSSVQQQNELFSPNNRADGMNNLPRYQRRWERYPPVRAFRPSAGHLYSGAMVNPNAYANHNQWNQHQYSVAHPPESSSLRNPKQLNINYRMLSSLLGTNDEVVPHPSFASARSPLIGNPLPRSLETQSGDLQANQERQRHQSLRFDYRDSVNANAMNTMLAKHRSNLPPRPPPPYQSAVQSPGSDGVSTRSTGSSPRSGQGLDDSPTIRNAQGHGSPGSWTLAKELSNSESIVIATVFGKRMHCLLKNNTLFVLLESLQRNFFRHCALDSWLYMLDVNCGAKTITLTAEEEAAFLECYQINSDHLLCNRAVAVGEFSKHLAKFQNALY